MQINYLMNLLKINAQNIYLNNKHSKLFFIKNKKTPKNKIKLIFQIITYNKKKNNKLQKIDNLLNLNCNSNQIMILNFFN